jgi:hypothetical protein
VLADDVFDESLVAGDLVSAATRPRRVVAVSTVERVVDDDLPSGKELDVRTAGAPVLTLLMPDPVIDGHDVEGLAHLLRIGRVIRGPKTAPRPGGR